MHYKNPTADAAISNVTREESKGKTLIFVCSPFRGDIKTSTHNARCYCRFVAAQGYVPVAPHLIYPQFLNDGDPCQRKLGIQFGLALLRHCKELWCFGPPTEGMKREIAEARRIGKRVRLFES